MYHFDLNYDIVRRRHDELVGKTTRQRVGERERRRAGSGARR